MKNDLTTRIYFNNKILYYHFSLLRNNYIRFVKINKKKTHFKSSIIYILKKIYSIFEENKPSKVKQETLTSVAKHPQIRNGPLPLRKKNTTYEIALANQLHTHIA